MYLPSRSSWVNVRALLLLRPLATLLYCIGVGNALLDELILIAQICWRVVCWNWVAPATSENSVDLLNAYPSQKTYDDLIRVQ